MSSIIYHTDTTHQPFVMMGYTPSQLQKNLTRSINKLCLGKQNLCNRHIYGIWQWESIHVSCL